MIATRNISMTTQGHCDVVDITPQVSEAVSDAAVREGSALLFVAGSTAGLTTVEYEPGLVTDLREAFERVAPTGIPYQHDRRWGDGNGFAHVRAALLGPHLVIPIHEGRLALGTWQQVVLVDFDNRPRSRSVVVQISGE